LTTREIAERFDIAHTTVVIECLSTIDLCFNLGQKNRKLNERHNIIVNHKLQ